MLLRSWKRLKVGNEQENWVVARFAASMWINTEVVACNGPRHMQPFGRKDTKVFPHLSSALKEATVLGTN